MNLHPTILRAALPALAIIALASCEDELSPSGSSIVNNEVQIFVDSTTLKIPATCNFSNDVDARSIYTQLGQIDVPEFGKLQSTYVTQLLAAAGLNIPDSIGVDKVDSTKLVVNIPRNQVTGDTLAPQQLTVYRLTKSLPSDIRSSFNPDGYYNPSQPISSKNYTLSGLNFSDSAFFKAPNLTVNVTLPAEWGRDAFAAYRNNQYSEIFQWPQTFCKEFPGLYIKSSFGKGAIANISATKVMIYYHYKVERTVVENEVAVKKVVTIKDSVALFSSAPEVISSSLYKFTPSELLKSLVSSNRKIITAPLGYYLGITFPAKDLLNQYWSADHNLAVINNLTLTLPAAAVPNSYGLLPPPELLMIKNSEIESFFAEGRLPDNKTSFRGIYKSDLGRYEFDSLRSYIVSLAEKKDSLTPEDLDFTLFPVDIKTEIVTQNDGSKVSYVTSCTPYISKPAMAEIFTDRAGIVFTYTSQMIK